MGRHASIQLLLLTLTGCSWMLLFLSVTLPDYHAFRAYHAARAHAAHAAHTPPPKEVDPCELCWAVGSADLRDAADGGAAAGDGDGWGSRLAKAMGASAGGADRSSPRPPAGAGQAGAGGVGAFYYYTLHTTFTSLRVTLKKAQQVAGDVQDEVATLGERVAHLQDTLLTHFSPRLNPYLYKPGLEHAQAGTDARQERPAGVRAQHINVSQQQQQKLSSRREELRHVYPAMSAEPSRRASQRTPLPARPPAGGARGRGDEDFVDSSHDQSQSIYPDLPSRRLQTPPRTSRRLHAQGPARGPASLVTRESQRTTRGAPRVARSQDEPLAGRDQQASVNISADAWQWRRAAKMGLVARAGERAGARGAWTPRQRERSASDKSREKKTSVINGDTDSVEPPPRGGVWASNMSASDVVKVVSVVVAGDAATEDFLASVSRAYPGVAVHVAAPTPPPRPPAHRLRLLLHTVAANASLVAAHVAALDHVTTPYVLLTSGMASLTRLARLERLVWAAEHLGVWAVSGGLQTPTNRWRTGCLTSRNAHYEAEWERGRLGAAHGCLLCSSLEGPFLALTAALRHLAWDAKLPAQVAQLDLFLRAAHSHHMLAAACPEALFRVRTELPPPPRAAWLSLARRHSLYVVQAPAGVRYTFSCSDVGANCGEKGVALPPCCRQELASLVRFLMDTCDAHGLLCELQEGTLLGAVKLNGVMPWERDADVTFHTKNYTALGELRDVFERAGYSLHLTDNRWCCIEGRWAGGQGALASAQWTLELWSQHRMDSEDDLLAGRPRTRVEFDGSWVSAPSSPGQYARNRYGHEMFRHAQHWLDTGRGSGWDNYEAGKFLPCPHPAHHACLDHYVPDGNLRLHPLCVS